MFCHQCGTSVSTRFCPKCGTEQVGTGQASAASAPTVSLAKSSTAPTGDLAGRGGDSMPRTAGAANGATVSLAKPPATRVLEPPTAQPDGKRFNGAPIPAGPVPMPRPDPVPRPDPAPGPDQGSHAGPWGDGGSSTEGPSRPSSTRLVAVVITLIVLAGGGVVGGKAIWAATAVRRLCALQGSDIEAATGVTPVSVSVTQGSSTLPFTLCDFSGSVSNERADGVVLTQDATEAGVSGGDSSNCLRGDYWGGRSLTCLTLSASSASSDGTTGTAPATVMVSATRFNGNASYSAEVTCVAPPSDSQPSADLEQTCWDRTTKVMATVASRLGVPSDSTTTASSDTLSTLVSLAGSGSGTSTSGTSDQSTPTDTPSDTSTPTDTPTDTPTATPTQDPVAALDQARASSLPNLNLDGHWAVQVASKFNGVTDPTETTASGSHTFGNADILAEYQSLATRFSAYPVMLVKGSDFTTAAGNDRIWVTLVDPGNLPDRAAALTWCSGQFPSLTGNALLNVCYPRQLTPR